MSARAAIRPGSESWNQVARGMSPAEADRRVKVKNEDGRGWHIDVWVRYPNTRRARRVRIANAPGWGKFESREEAERAANRIRALAEQRPLHEVLVHYARRDVPENFVPYRWEHEWLPEIRRRARTREITVERAANYESWGRRGLLKFWARISLHAVEEGLLKRWLGWLRDEFPQFKPITLRHVVADFGTFLRWERELRVLERVPELPKVKVPKERRAVPTRAALRRVLDAIPEEIRGLWLGHAQAGLRPREARGLNVANYRDGALYVPAEIVKTKEARTLRIDIVAPELDAWIRAHRVGASPGEPLFVNPRAHRGTMRWAKTAERERWVAACEAAGVEYVAPNRGGRHAFATHEAKAGTNLLALQHWMGHAQFKTTQQYIDEFDEVEVATLMRPGPPIHRPAPRTLRKP